MSVSRQVGIFHANNRQLLQSAHHQSNNKEVCGPPPSQWPISSSIYQQPPAIICQTHQQIYLCNIKVVGVLLTSLVCLRSKLTFLFDFGHWSEVLRLFCYFLKEKCSNDMNIKLLTGCIIRWLFAENKVREKGDAFLTFGKKIIHDSIW